MTRSHRGSQGGRKSGDAEGTEEKIHRRKSKEQSHRSRNRDGRGGEGAGGGGGKYAAGGLATGVEGGGSFRHSHVAEATSRSIRPLDGLRSSGGDGSRGTPIFSLGAGTHDGARRLDSGVDSGSGSSRPPQVAGATSRSIRPLNGLGSSGGEGARGSSTTSEGSGTEK
jgi:hypothetical protein